MPTLADVSRSRMLESVYDRFESAWQRGEEPDIDEFAADMKDESRRRQVLQELVLIDLEYRWRRAAVAIHDEHELAVSKSTPSPFASNGRPFVEDYIERWPEFGPLDRLPVSAIVHEFRVRCDAGDTPELAEYFRRFPIQSRSLHEALQVEVEDRLHVTKSVQPTRPLESASTGPEDNAISDDHRAAKRRLAPGDQLGRYRILWPVGHGAMGVVYLAYDPDLDRQIAIKVPFLDGPHAERLTQRFRREAKLTASLRHPNICRVLDVDRQNNVDFLTMDYVDGTSLETLIKTGPLMPPAQAVQIVRKIASALQEAHAAGVIHRDVKPSNILIDRRSEPVLTDFGLARRPEIDESEQTRPGEWLGTPAYMAPEQFSGNSDDVTPGCDVFSLGVVLYRLLTGQRPFGDVHRREEVAQRMPPVAPHLVRAGLVPALSEVCLHALRFDPRQRYNSAGEFAAALEPFAMDFPAEASRHGSNIVPIVARPPATLRSLNRSAALLLIVFASVSGGLAAWAMLKDDPRPLVKKRANTSTPVTTKDSALRLLPRLELHFQRAKQTDGYQVLDAGVGALKDDDKMQFHVTLDEPAFVALFYIEADGIVKRLRPDAEYDDNVLQKDVWDPPLASADELQEMYVLGKKAGIEMIVAVASSQAFAESELEAIERLRLNPIPSDVGFSFVTHRETPARDESQQRTASASIRLTEMPLGDDPRRFGSVPTGKSRGISGRTSTQKSEWLNWEQFAERLAQIGEFSHGLVFRHAP